MATFLFGLKCHDFSSVSSNRKNKWGREVLPEIYENPAIFGPWNFFLVPFQIESGAAPFHFLGFRCLDSGHEFSYINTKVTVCEDPLCRNKQKRGRIWTSGFLSETYLRKNPVATKWHHFYFWFQMPWFQQCVFQHKEWMGSGAFKDPLCRKSSKTMTNLEIIFNTLSRRNPVKAEWHLFIFGFQMSWF